jgi:hypothetical protein
MSNQAVGCNDKITVILGITYTLPANKKTKFMLSRSEKLIRYNNSYWYKHVLEQNIRPSRSQNKLLGCGLVFVPRFVCLLECGRFHVPNPNQCHLPEPCARTVRYSTDRAALSSVHTGSSHRVCLQHVYGLSVIPPRDFQVTSINPHSTT